MPFPVGCVKVCTVSVCPNGQGVSANKFAALKKLLEHSTLNPGQNAAVCGGLHRRGGQRQGFWGFSWALVNAGTFGYFRAYRM